MGLWSSGGQHLSSTHERERDLTCGPEKDADMSRPCSDPCRQHRFLQRWAQQNAGIESFKTSLSIISYSLVFR